MRGIADIRRINTFEKQKAEQAQRANVQPFRTPEYSEDISEDEVTVSDQVEQD